MTVQVPPTPLGQTSTMAPEVVTPMATDASWYYCRLLVFPRQVSDVPGALVALLSLGPAREPYAGVLAAPFAAAARQAK